MLENKQSIVNKVRNNYNSMEEYYLEQNNIPSPPICKSCNINTCKFISIFKGYRSYCKECQLGEYRYKNANNVKRETLIKYRNSMEYAYYINHVFNNIDEYKNISFPYYDTFLEKEISRFIVLDTSDIYLNRTCLVTGEKYKYELLNHDDMANYISYDKKAVFIRNHVTINEVKLILSNMLNLDLLYSIYFKNKYTLKLMQILLDSSIFNELKKLIFMKKNEVTIKKLSEETLKYNFTYDNKKYEIVKSGIDVYKTHYIDVTDIVGKDVLCDDFHIYECVTCKKKYFDFKVKFFHKKNIVKICKQKNVSNKSCGDQGCYVRGKGAWEYDLVRKNNISNGIKKSIQNKTYTPKDNRKTVKGRYIVDNIKMRSTWEVIFYLYNKFKKIDIMYEHTRIRYGEKNNVYLIDFTTKDTLFEVKPIRFLNDDKVKLKAKYAKEYAKTKGMEYKIITENEIKCILKDSEFYSYISSYDILHGKSIVLNAIDNFLKESL